MKPFLAFLALLVAAMPSASAAPSTPPRHQLVLAANGDVDVIAPDGARATFSPHFTVLFSATNPNLETRWGRYKDAGLRSGDQGSTYHVLNTAS